MYDAADVADVALGSQRQVLAGIGVVMAAVALAVLPLLAASGIGAGALARVAAGLGFVVAIWGGVKVAAVILGAAGFVRRHRDGVFAAAGD